LNRGISLTAFGTILQQQALTILGEMSNAVEQLLYVDVPWLVDIQRDLGINRNDQLRPFSTTVTTQAGLYVGLNRLYDTLLDEQAEHLQKHDAALAFMVEVQQALSPAQDLPRHGNRGLMRAAEFIRDNYARSLKLDEICSAANLSASYLIRVCAIKRTLERTKTTSI
jgi:hypothetical protein